MSGPCPDEDRLVAEVMDPADLQHLAGCVQCRRTRKLLLVYNQEPEALPEGVSVDLPADLRRKIEQDLAAAPTPSGDATDSRFLAEDRQWKGTSERGILYGVFDRVRQRRVALKYLHDVDVERLTRVAAAIDELRHPNLARYFDVLPGERLRVSRELYEGEDLEQALEHAQRHRMLRWVGLVISALAALHGRGLAHGGVSPSNVRIDPGGRVMVTDAGLGALPARSPWRAPELGPGEATPAGDWYALGAILARHAPQLSAGDGRAPYTVASVCQRMGDPDPAHRPGGSEILGVFLLEQGLGGLDASRYQIDERIARGGMGDLYRVHDPVLRRTVALKRMTEGTASKGDGLRRFLAEARVAAQLQHPNIVPVHELDWMPDGSPFFTMKLIDGQELDKVVAAMHAGRPDGWTLHRAVAAVLRLCEAVSYAHSQGVLHLDLKPKNVLVGRYGEVQLIDWGLARVIPQGGRGVDIDARNAAPPRVGFSPGWSAPEQRPGGDPQQIARHSDVYALGAVLFHVLTNAEPPKEEPIPPVSAQSPTAPRELAAVVARATSWRPEGRYPDAEALGRDVQAWLDGEPVAAYVYSPLERIERRTRGRRGYWGLGLVSILAIGTVGWFAFLVWLDSERARQGEIAREGQVLAERARLADMTGDRVEAERRAAESIVLAETPEARGLLARLGRRWYPRQAGPCTREDAVLTCAGAGGAVTWTVGSGRPPRPMSDPPAAAPALSIAGLEDGGGRAPCGPNIVVHEPDGLIGLFAPGGERVAGFGALATAPPACDGSGARIAFGVGEEVNVWRVAPLREDALPLAHAGAVVATAWSGDGRWLASGDATGTVRLWDTATWTERARLPDHGAIEGLAFVGQQALLLVAADSARAWDLGPAPAPAVIEAMVPLRQAWWGASTLATLDRQGTWRAWDPATGRFTGDALPGRASVTVDAAFDPSGRAVAAVDDAGALRAYELVPLRRRWGPVAAGATAVAWGGPPWLATGGADGVVRWWDAVTGQPLASGPDGAAIAALGAVGDLVLVRRVDGSAELLDGLPARSVERWAGVGVAALDATGQQVAIGELSGLLSVVEIGAGVGTVSRGEPVLAVAFSPDGRTLAAARADQTVRVYVRGPDGWIERARALADLRSAAGLAFSPTGDGLAVIGVGSEVEVWDLGGLGRRPADVVAEVDARYGAAPERNEGTR